MTIIAVSQHIIVNPERNERNDALDQRWGKFFKRCGLTVLPIPNESTSALSIIDSAKPQGVLLTGGGDITDLGGTTPERDETERHMVDWARAQNLPVMGVCRGMQFIQNMFGISLQPVEGHIALRHTIRGRNTIDDVNSFHGFGAFETVPELEIHAKAEDGVIEAIAHKSEKIYAIMWHPEREASFREPDIALFSKYFGAAGK